MIIKSQLKNGYEETYSINFPSIFINNDGFTKCVWRAKIIYKTWKEHRMG